MDCLSGSLPEGCADVEGKDFLWSDAGEGAISIVYSDIHVQPYAISGQNVWCEWKFIPYFATSTTRNASDWRLSNRVDDTRCLLIILWRLTVI